MLVTAAALCLLLPAITAALGVAVIVTYGPRKALVWLCLTGVSVLASLYALENGSGVIVLVVLIEAAVNTPITLGVLMTVACDLSDPRR